MIPVKLESEADFEHSTISESLSVDTELSPPSCCQNQDTRIKGAAEPRKKAKKLRSIKLVKLPSLRLATRQGKIQSDFLSLLCSDAASVLQPTQFELPDASPNYMKTTTSSDAKKESLQKSARALTRRSSFKPAKNLTRLSSTKFRRSMMRKSFGGSDMKKKLKKSRSIKLGKRFSIVLPDDADTSPGHLNAISSSDVENTHFQASSQNSESSLSNIDNKNKKNSRNLNSASGLGNKSMRVVTRTSSLRPPRILTKMASLRTKRSSMKKCSQMLDSTVNKATCSSALKDSKITDHLELQPGGNESEGISTMKICPYSYCSLHGHQHSTVAPLKRFVSMRRRMLKTQKSIKLESQSSHRAKHSSDTKKEIQRSGKASHRDAAVLEAEQKSREVASMGKMSGGNAESYGDASNNGADRDAALSKSFADSMVGESSHPYLCLRENLQVSKLATAEKSIVPTLLLQRETSKEHSTDKQEEETMKSNSYKCDFSVDNPVHVDFSLQKMESLGRYDMLPFDESACASHEDIPAGGRVHKEVNGDKISSLNLDVLKGDSESNTSQANTSTSVDDEPFIRSRNQTSNLFLESKVITGMSSSASSSELVEEQTAAGEESNEESSAGSESDYSTDLVNKTGMEKQKNIGLWNLIYQHMVSGIAEGDEKQLPLNKMNEEKKQDDQSTFSEIKKNGSFSDFSGVGQNTGGKDPNGGSPKSQLYQCNAIKLVREAFDKILSEIPDHTSDDQLINSGATSAKELAGKNHGEGKELTISTFFDSGKDNTLHEQKEINFKAGKMNGSEREKAESKMEGKSNQQTPKNWSNLKKIIILRRFVKALEKVTNIKPHRPLYLPVQPDPEAEKVHLRHQTMGDRKNSEEWMLDYALQQVISTLAPAQKRKVALLVQAFETIGPLPESSASLRGSETGKEINYEISLHKTSCHEMSSKENHDQVCDSCTADEHISESLSDVRKPSSEPGNTHTAFSNLASETTAAALEENFGALNPDNSYDNFNVDKGQPDSTKNCLLDLQEHNLCDQPSSKSAAAASIPDDEVLGNEEVLEARCLISASEVYDSDFRFNGQKLATNYKINEGDEKSEQEIKMPKRLEGSIASSNVVTSVPVMETIEESSEATEVKTMLRNKFLQALSSHEVSKSNSADVTHENQKNMRLWYLIYKHMVSGTATALDEATDKEEQRADANTLHQDHALTHKEFPVMSQDVDMENHNTDNRKVELEQIEAIRMVEEAIDEISLPDIQDDSPDDQSVTTDITANQEHLERQSDDRGEVSISNSIIKKSYGESNNKKLEQMTPDSKEPSLISDKEKTELDKDSRLKLSTKKSWSNLKKIILLKRFIKSVERVKKFNPRKPQFLPFDPEKEPEKVHLKHQGIEDRKNADEWMLDYALQQVVAKLTPARKRKVQLLVEAFETVSPTIGS